VAFSTSNFRKGLKIEVDGELCEVVDFQHVKVARGGAKVKTKLRNLTTGSVVERSFAAGTTFAQPDFEVRKLQYLYSDPSGYHFMNTDSFDQMTFTTDQLGDGRYYIEENETYQAGFYRGELMGLELEAHAFVTIVETEPAARGDTVSNVTKRAVAETGLVLKVPLFVDMGDRVKVDTRNGEYLERA
jgi:elongation factor P